MVRAKATAIFIAAVCGASTATAQTERSGAADARVMQQLQQLTAERAALQSENAALKAELEKLRKDVTSATAAKASLENRNRALEVGASRGQASQQQTAGELEQSRARMQELVTRFRETAQTLRDVETDRAQVKTQLADKERELNVCIERNAALYHLNGEVLNAMENRGFWSAVAEREPFTRLKRVELENLIDDYRYRAEELRRP